PPLPPWAPQPFGSAQGSAGGSSAAAPSQAPPSAFPQAAPAAAEPVAGPELTRAQQGVIEILRGLADPVFAILDGSAAAPGIEAIRSSGGTVERLSDATGACLTSVNPESVAAAQLAEGWGKGWGIFVTSRQPIAIVRNHLRRFQTLLSSDGM